MSKARVAGIAAAMLVVGFLAGLAGTAVARDGSATDCTTVMAEHMQGQDLADMASMMDGSASMMGSGMMGSGTMGSGMMGMPGSQHDLHHRAATPGATK